MKRFVIIGILIVAVAGSLSLAVKSESATIATFEECVKAGWLVRSIKVYDGFGPIEEECTLWSGKSFVKQRSEDGQQTDQPVNGAQGNWETKTDDRPPVTIKVTPVEFGKGAETWKFQVVFDTHSGSLDNDLLAAASLADDKGNVYRPVAWEGPGPGGHHREGVLRFTPLSPTPPTITLNIRDVGGIPERIFTWEVK